MGQGRREVGEAEWSMGGQREGDSMSSPGSGVKCADLDAQPDPNPSRGRCGPDPGRLDLHLLFSNHRSEQSQRVCGSYSE